MPMLDVLPSTIGAAACIPALFLLWLVVYVVAWVHANTTLSHYQRLARQRLSEMDQRGETDADTLLERGLLLQKVLGDTRAALGALDRARALPNGEPALLYQAGVVMSSNKRYPEAAEFFDRAAATAADAALITQLKKKRARLAGKLRVEGALG